MKVQSSVFLAHTLYTFYKSSPAKCRLLNFHLLQLKFIWSFMSFFKQKVSLSSKFRSLLSVMRHSSSVVSYLNFKMLLTKVIYQSANFQTCNCWHENSPNSLCYFLKQKSVFSSNLASPFNFMRHSLLEFFI